MATFSDGPIVDYVKEPEDPTSPGDDGLTIRNTGPQSGVAKLPFGSLRLFAWFLCQAVLYWFINEAGYSRLVSQTGFQAVVTFLVAAVLHVVFYLGGGCLLLSIDGKVEPWKEPFRFIKHIWHRNAIGYDRTFWQKDGELKSHTWCQTFWRAWYEADDAPFMNEDMSGYSFSFPLGGWFARPYVVKREKLSGVKTGGWGIRLIPKHLFEHSGVALTDSKGSCLTRDLKGALEFINRPSSCWPATINGITQLMEGKLTFSEKKNKEDDGHIEALIDLHDQSVQRIADTKRLQHVKSTDGMNIRMWLLEKLLPLLPAGDKRKERLTRDLIELLPKDDPRAVSYWEALANRPHGLMVKL